MRFTPLINALPGVFFCALLAIGSVLFAEQMGGPMLLYALLAGMIFHPLSRHALLADGIQLTSKKILRIGVALLGARISVEEILSFGWTPVMLAVIAVPVTIAFGVVCARLLGLTRSQGVLTGGSVAVCGASAAIAIAAVLPQRPETERQLLFTIVGVTALSTVAMVLYPLLANLLDMDDMQAGFFIGGSIHDVAQVVGAGYIISDAAGDTATFTKLLRVAMLVPVVIAISVLVARGEAKTSAPLLPGFLVGFLLLIMLNSLGWIPAPALSAIDWVSRAFLVAAIAAIGVKASFRELAAVGWKPVALILLETVFLALLILLGLHLSP